MVGAHLDSVVEGPGINDNGSGTATILEIAEEMAELGYTKKNKLQRQVRFAFWGAEESNLLGSKYYVDNLSGQPAVEDLRQPELRHARLAELRAVRLRRRRVGHSSRRDRPGRRRSRAIFTDYFASQGLASAPTEFSGRSDYGPFIAVGIPAGGLFSGAEGIKTPEEAAIYGGTAGEPYDPCYHQACDDINNLSTKALVEMGDAAAHATLTLAKSKTGLFEDGSRVGQRSAKAGVKMAGRGHAHVR